MEDTNVAAPLEDERAAPFRRRVRSKLSNALVVWLVTSDGSGRPHPSPVWFLWEGDGDLEGSTVLVYSQPNAAKLRHIAAQEAVALHFDTDPRGTDVVILYGRAHHDDQAPPAADVPAYLDKYRDAIADLGSTEQAFSSGYSAALRITLERVRGS